jgi:erythromycin esterase-like protein
MRLPHFINNVLFVALFLATQIAQAQYGNLERQLKSKVTSLDSTSLATNSPFDLRGIIHPNFKVLAIGEQSHGTSEFFKARVSLIKSVMTIAPLTKIGLEAPMAEVEVLNRYILDGQGDLKQMLGSFRLFNYECKEFTELVESIRKLNKSAKTPVLFYGFDMQSPFQSLQNILESCLTNDAGTADSVRKLIGNYRTLNNEMYSHSISKADFDELENLSNHIIKKVELGNAPCVKTDLIRKSIANYKQFLMLNDPTLTYDTQANLRDSLMAENALRELKDGDKIVILAHNGHVQRTRNAYSKSMGLFLSQKLGGQYQCIGLTTSSGFYTAFTPEAGRVTDKNPIPVADRESFEYEFSKIGIPIFLFKTSVVKENLGSKGLPVKYKLLPFGLTNRPFVTGNLLEDFDYLLHIERTTGNQSFYLK